MMEPKLVLQVMAAYLDLEPEAQHVIREMVKMASEDLSKRVAAAETLREALFPTESEILA